MKNRLFFLLLLFNGIAIAQNKGTFTDSRDGNIYNTIQIGKQVWIIENLRFKLNSVTSYDGKQAEEQTFGLLYNFETARNACPAGWHIPSDMEWKILINYLGGKNMAGGKMKGGNKWKSNNKLASNSSGFNAFPGGAFIGGRFQAWAEAAYFWGGEAECTSGNAVYLNFNAGFADARMYPKSDKLSVRCIKD